MSIPFMQPEFGDDLPRRPVPCTPVELYRHLLDVEDNPEYLPPAFAFAAAALEAAPATDGEPAPAAFLGRLIEAARAELDGALPPHGASWPARVVREFAPAGLLDGVWLQGLIRANVVETAHGMAALTQYMPRFGDAREGDSYFERYALLLQSVGIVAESIARWEPDDALPCAGISYEHALLGLSLSFFPQSFTAETLGFNLWMTAVGPCPLLAAVAGDLRARRACLRYLDEHDGPALRQHAEATAAQYIAAAGDPDARARVGRGFLAAHRSYQRWEAAMRGANVPLTARDFVLEGIARKAPFAIGHHGGVAVGGHDIEALFRGGRAGHQQLLAHLVSDGLVQPGDPDRSHLLVHSLSIDGPMFEVFSPAEQRDLREWVTALANEEPPPDRPPVPLAGCYEAPQNADALQRYAAERFGGLPPWELLYCCANADRFPGARIAARRLIEGMLGKIGNAFATDPRLAGPPPPWSERGVAELAVERHHLNLRRRGAPAPKPAEPALERPPIGVAFDGAWLQGFADVGRSAREEYKWLFRIYASEQGDGEMAWNHNRIARQAWPFRDSGPMLPATGVELYKFCAFTPTTLFAVAASLNTRRFLPELLGCNLGIEATGVCGSYLDQYHEAERGDNRWAALNFRLHNGIDNYVTGHTRWAVAAVQAFMSRVSDNAPAAVDAQWRRIWRMWRTQEIVEHGSDEERQALRDALGFQVTSLAATAGVPPAAA